MERRPIGYLAHMLLVRNRPVVPPRPRRTAGAAGPVVALRRLGLTGSLLLAVGSLGAGALPEPDPLAGMRLLGLPARNTTLSLAVAYAGAAVIVIAWAGLARRLCRAGPGPSGSQLARAAVLWSVPLALVPPLFSRDVYSYLAQGAILARRLDPYALGPAPALGIDNPLVRGIPTMWRETASPYGPLFLGLSRAINGLTGEDVVLGVLAHRALELGGLALVVWALPALARRSGVDPRRALWFGAANPLVLFHLVSGAHNEALMLGLMLSGMELGLRAGHRADDPRLLAGAALVVAGSAVKLPAILALGVLGLHWARERGGRPRDLAVATGLLTSVAVAGCAVLSTIARVGLGWTTTLGVPTTVDSPLSPSTDLGFVAGRLGVRVGLGDHTDDLVRLAQGAGLLAAAILVAWCLRATWRGRLDPVAAVAGAMGAVVVLGPTGQPWYLLWSLLPLVATTALPRFRAAMLVASAVIAVVVPPTGGDFALRGYQLVAAILGALAAVTAMVWWHQRVLGAARDRVSPPGPPPRTRRPMFDKLQEKLGLTDPDGEDDVTGDAHLAQSRATGGADGGTGDADSTTGTGESEEFVGRVSGQDDGAERLTGAEARAFGTDTERDTPSHADPVTD